MSFDTGRVLGDRQVGDIPWGIAFDGVDIWVTNIESNNVARIRPGRPGARLYPVGHGPRGVLFDGTSIWVANDLESTVTKLTPQP